MTFTSLPFLLFLAVVFLLYYLLPRRAQWMVLLAASYAFYMICDLRAVVFLLGTTAVVFVSGVWLGRIQARGDAAAQKLSGAFKKRHIQSTGRRKKAVLAVALLCVFGLLFLMKYANFFFAGVNGLLSVFSSSLRVGRLDLLLPLGLSFYIFQSAGYLIDVYRKKYPPDRNPARLALFVSFFPQIVQGPIGRYDRLAGQLFTPHKFDADQLKYGLQLMLWGFFKKLLIADRAAVLVDAVFKDYTKYGGGVLFVGVVFYCIQIYCDFSGGIDIAHGVAQGLGIQLDENFTRPYFAASVSEFWRRWHITLGAWMKDYLYYPIALWGPIRRLGKPSRKLFGARVGKIIPASIVTFIVFTVIGLWHGASMKYIVFGFYNGGIIALSMLLAPVYEAMRKRLRIQKDGVGWRVVSALRTFLLLCIGRYFSRAATYTAAMVMLKRTVTVPRLSELTDGTLLKLGLSGGDFLVLGLSVAVLFAVSLWQESGREVRRTLETKSFAVQWLVMVVAIGAILFLGVYREGYIAQQFIYAGF